MANVHGALQQSRLEATEKTTGLPLYLQKRMVRNEGSRLAREEIDT